MDSIPKEKLSALLDESFKALNGAGYDLGSLLDSVAQLTSDLNGVADQTPCARSTTACRCSIRRRRPPTRSGPGRAASPASPISSRDNDPRSARFCRRAPAPPTRSSTLLDQVKPTLPVLLANLTTVGQVGVTYHASLEQLLVLLPPYVAAIQSVGADQQPDRACA